MGAPRRSRPGANLPISTAQGAFPADLAAARRFADITLRSLDLTKRDIVLWVQGSGNNGMHPFFEEAALRQWGGLEHMSLSYLRYTAGRDMRPSVATGVATLKLVLAGIAAHGGSHRVLLTGDSQGAWVLGEAVADPAVRKVVTRAVMLGHPSLARHHAASRPGDAILEVNKPSDPVASPVRGSQDDAVDTFTAIYMAQVARLPLVLKTILLNPMHAVRLVQSWLSFVPALQVDNPHGYNEFMSAVAAFLDTGSHAALADAIAGSAQLGPLPEGHRP